MAGDAGDKTELPTPRRRQEARDKGQIARSHDLASALLLLGAMLCLRWMGPHALQTLLESMQRHLSVESPSAAAKLDVVVVVQTVGFALLSACGPLFVAMLVFGLISHLMQVGFVFTTEPLTPNLGRLSPISGIKRILSTRALVQLAMNLVKLVIITMVAWSAISNRLEKIFLALEVTGWAQLIVLSQIIYEVGLILAVLLLVIALFDYAWQRYRHEQDLKMSKQEVKEEMRSMEGDPIIKQRRRRMQLAAVMQQIRKSVPTADVVVTNPTELAVAIKYDAKAMQAPRVVAKGADYLAAKIREIAASHGVPIVERKPLAQALYKSVEVGQEVPEQFYQAIAEILAYVYELSGRAARLRRAPAA